MSTTSLSAVEQRGIEPVPARERNGNPLQLFWGWFAANISILGLPLGARRLTAPAGWTDDEASGAETTRVETSGAAASGTGVVESEPSRG